MSTDVLVLVLQHVPLSERMQSCALTCRSWHAAANQATTSITRSAEPEQQLQLAYRVAWSLPGWLFSHGNSLHIDVGFSREWQVHMRLPLQQLPQLKHLHLSLHGNNTCNRNRNTTTSSSSTLLAPLAGSLTALELQHCTLQASVAELAVITVLTGLHRLHLAGIALWHAAAGGYDQQSNKASILPVMTYLTSLSLADTRPVDSWNRPSSFRAMVLAAVQDISRLYSLAAAGAGCGVLRAVASAACQLAAAAHTQPAWLSVAG
jgi:hypothetical protein